MISLNREQRRKKVRALHRAGLTRSQASDIVRKGEESTMSISLSNGDKVKINVDRIKQSRSWNDGSVSEKYRDFVEKNVDREFSVRKSVQMFLYTLDEDDSDPKWFWFASDLIKVTDGDEDVS